ncbi:DUF302 domain-containing protein [Planosporangium flavigriseum]|uniref:DUF302 domain-containing protein n=1 Tax=Planosporangium flavigriseum TaxID=373681 RepID=A0A8J3LTT0_9ACTN|nr:DUF302 domain-containing protein [Planosporangium flavigriseum]NJC66633.1 DUF302 domain-containing protein [Planosporangium flavigriseum]GIG73506.1 hypothetical protein Pfl04_19100 [Planosporangium flavigriseum]
MTQPQITAVDWAARRLAIEVDGSFDDAVARYEAAVPRYPAARFDQLVADTVGWQTVLDLTDELAEHGFLIYWRLAADPLMGLAGNTARCTAYLMGNHTIAERMFRHDPAAMLYAPLRTVISQPPGGPTLFATEQPSRQFSSLGNPDITAVGIELDHKLAGLLDALHWPVPPCLTT